MRHVRNQRFTLTAFAAFALAALFSFNTQFAFAGAPPVAPDATGMGPLAVTNAEYQFPATMDTQVLDVRPTEVWAVLHRPADLSGGPYPLLVFLHGNHGTCGTGMNPRVDSSSQYTTTGTCPPGFVVTPNHRGYDYVAERLASWGYIVISINANRGITAGAGVAGDAGLNLARGRLILRHLQRLSVWNSTAGTTPLSLGLGASGLLGKIDFSQVGLMGHSRGGEGSRAAYTIYHDPGSIWPPQIGPVTFQGIFEIGAVDGQTSRVLNASGTRWIQLLPYCDGDVSNLQGVRPLDRMLRDFSENPQRLKGSYSVWGANHNYYNTEWQVSDSGGCAGPFHTPLFAPGGSIGSASQRQTGLVSLLAFFRGAVGATRNPAFLQNFNPSFLPPPALTNVSWADRGFSVSPAISAPFEDFDQATGIGTYGIPNIASNITINHGAVPRHDPIQRAGAITWGAPGANVFFQTHWAAAGMGFDISAFETLTLRVSRQDNPLNPNNAATTFSVRLVMADGSLSAPVQLDASTLRYGPFIFGPLGGPGGLHPILMTARIPLTDFAGADLTQIRGVRLTFDGTATGAIFVANIRAHLASALDSGSTEDGMMTAGGPIAPKLLSAYNLFEGVGVDNTVIINEGNEISIREVASAELLNNQPGVEIEVTSDQEFPIRNELVVLSIGAQEFVLSGYPNGDTHTLVFTLTNEEFAQLTDGEQVTVKYGRGEASGTVWSFGRLNKSLLNK